MLKTHYGETLLLILALVMGFIMAVAVILLDGIALNISNIFKIWAMISLVIILVSIFIPYKSCHTNGNNLRISRLSFRFTAMSLSEDRENRAGADNDILKE